MVSSIWSTLISSPWYETDLIEEALLATDIDSQYYRSYFTRGKYFCSNNIYLVMSATNIISADPSWGFNPISRRYVKKSGAVYHRLVKSGVVSDPEIASQLSSNRLAEAWATVKGRPPRIVAAPEPEPEKRVSRLDAAVSRKQTKRLIAQHVDELEGLPPDQVDTMIRRLMSMKLAEDENVLPTRAPPQREPGSISARWKALQAAPTPTETETDLPDTSGISDGTSDDDVPRSAPIRIPRRATATRGLTRRRAR